MPVRAAQLLLARADEIIFNSHHHLALDHGRRRDDRSRLWVREINPLTCALNGKGVKPEAARESKSFPVLCKQWE